MAGNDGLRIEIERKEMKMVLMVGEKQKGWANFMANYCEEGADEKRICKKEEEIGISRSNIFFFLFSFPNYSLVILTLLFPPPPFNSSMTLVYSSLDA